jgi:hypothetical protein
MTVKAATGLPALEAKVRRDLEVLAYPAKAWVDPVQGPAGEPVLDCAIVGGGQFGLALAFGLARERVENVQVFDAAVEGFEGPWMTFAQMETLRTPKDLTGPDLGVPSLSFRAWYEAQHGAEGWAALGRSPAPTGWPTFGGTAACSASTCTTPRPCGRLSRSRASSSACRSSIGPTRDGAGANGRFRDRRRGQRRPHRP